MEEFQGSLAEVNTSRAVLNSQTTALEKIQRGLLPVSQDPRTEQVFIRGEEPIAGRRSVLDGFEETNVMPPAADSRVCGISPSSIPGRRGVRYEVDGGVTIAGGRPGENEEPERSDSDTTSVTLPPPYLSIFYP